MAIASSARRQIGVRLGACGQVDGHTVIREKKQTEVISLTDIGPVGSEIANLGVPVRALGMKRGIPNPILLLRLARWLRNASPDIVQTWMYHADLIGGLAAMFAGQDPCDLRCSSKPAGSQ